MTMPPRGTALSVAGARKAPALLEAVHATVSTIDKRGRIYRRAAASLSVGFAGPVMITLVLLTWRPLAYLAFLVPIVGAFVVADGRAVLRWQRHVLDLWRSSDMTMAEFRDMVTAMRHLPAGTVNGMLGRLPLRDPAEHTASLCAERKASLATTCLRAAAHRDALTWLWTAGTAVVACSIAVAASTGLLAMPLVGGVLGLTISLTSRWRSRDR